jgi:hypothetical protein
MALNYTTLLGLAEPITGTESGTWGDDVNQGITEYLDIAIAGTQLIDGSQTAVTLSVTNGSSAASNIAQVGTGATGSSQYQIIRCIGAPASLLTITAPASSKTYIIINSTSTSQSVKIAAAGPTTGVTVVSGERCVVVWSGSDFVKVASSVTAASSITGTLPIANGGTGQTTASAAFNALSPITSTGDLIVGNGVNSATRLSIGTNGYILTSNGTTPSWQVLPAGGLTYIFTTTAVTATDKQGVLTSTAGGAFTVTLPATPSVGAQVVVADAGNSWGVNNLTVGRNGSTIGGLAEDLVCDINGVSVQFVYDGTTWETYAQIGGNGGTAVTLTGTQTLTNKTLTSPVITQNIQVISTNTAAVRSRTYVFTATLTLTLPASPTAGDMVMFSNNSGTTTPVIGRNGSNIEGIAEDMTVDNVNYFGTLVYADATRGWIFQ